MESSKKIRHLVGKVVSAKMQKTIVVLVEYVKTHPKYGKQYKFSKKYKVHCPNNDYQVGEKVAIVACRPISRDKRWIVIKKTSDIKK